jgi:hypothetical protein
MPSCLTVRPTKALANLARHAPTAMVLGYNAFE